MRHDNGDGAGDLDVWTLAGVIWARRKLVLTTALIVVVAAGAVLMSITPRYTSQAKIIIEDLESSFTRPARDGEDQFLSDQAAVLSQVEVLSSRDLANKVVEKLDLARASELTRNPAGESFIGKLMSAIGLKPAERETVVADRAVEAYQRGLTVFQIGTSRVIAVEFSSADPQLAADIANTLSEEYIAVQRVNKYDTNQDAIAWLSREIEQLREKVSDAEAKVAKFRSESGIFRAERDTSLGEQQLSELNAELIRASAAQSEAQTKAKLINDLLKEPGSIEEAADVLSSPLIQRLREQQASVSREHAELSATLLPGHPRMRELTAELRDLDGRIASEARKIARGLENEALLAGARVEAIRNSLAELKVNAGENTQAQVQLRALEREAAAQREILESFLRRYREASARQDVDVQPANARIISKASVASSPSYPPHGPILALAGVAGVLLGLMAAIISDMVGRGRAAPAGHMTSAPAGREIDLPAGRRVDVSLAGSSLPPAREAPHAASTVPAVGQPIGKRIARLASERGVRRIAVARLTESADSLDIALRLAEAVEANGMTPVTIEVANGSGDGGEVGLFDVLSGNAALGDAMKAAGKSGGHVIRAGKLPDNAVEFVRAGRISLVVDALLRRFDLAILAVGGLNDGDIPIEIARNCDLALIAAPSSEISGDRIKEAMADLKAAGVSHTAVVSEGPDALTLYDAVSVRGTISDAA